MKTKPFPIAYRIAVAAALLATTLVPSGSATATGATLSFAPTDDARVNFEDPDTNYGADLVLAVDGSPPRRSFLWFAVQGIGTNTVERATLRLYGVNPALDGGQVTRLLESFSESAVTWNSMPAEDPSPIAPIGRVPLDWVEIDLTSVVTADGGYGFGLGSSLVNGASFASKEYSSGNAPELVVALAGIDTQPPEVWIESPSDGAEVSGTVPVHVSAADNVQATSVQLLVDGSPVAEDQAAPFELPWNTRAHPDGTHELIAVARDAAGNESGSAPVTVSVANGSAFTFAAAGDHAATEFSAASLGVLDSTGASFYLALGDMDYDQTPTDEAWCEFVKTHLPTLGPEFPFELVAGNHEDQDGPDGYILNHAACLPDRMGSTASPAGEYGSEYYFDYPPGDPLMRVILISPALTIENEYFDYDDGTIYQEWLAGTIEDAHARDIPWVVVGMHKNCLTAGRKNCSVGRELTDMLLEKGVDLVLQGHDHNYQRSKQLALDPFECPGIVPGTFDAGCIADDGSDGRYEAGAGTVFVIGGMFGEDHYPVSPGDVEAPYFAVLDGSTFGIVRYTVSRFALEATFLPSSGSFTDTFTIVRAPPPDGTPPTASIVAPPDGSTVGGTTPIVVEAADDTGVASVELLVDGTAIGVDGSAPYSFGWDTRAVPDGIHEIAAVARDHAANATTSVAIHVTVDNTAPAVPTGLVADAGADAVQLSWDAASDPAGIARYLVFRDGARNGTTQTNAFSDTAVQPGSTYAYAVAAVDGLGNASAPSNPVSATIPASPNTLSFGVTTDTLIRPDAPNTNFGSFPVLGVDAVPVRVSLLSFRVEGIGTRTVDRATLRLYSVNGSIEGGRVTRLLEPFSEHAVTWNTAPMHDPETIAQIGQVPLNGWIEVDLTSLVTADGEYGLRITSALGDGVGYASREHLSGRFPELVVTLAPAGALLPSAGQI